MSRGIGAVAISAAIATALSAGPVAAPAGGAGAAETNRPLVQVFSHPELPFTLAYRSLQPGEAILARLNDGAAVKKIELKLDDQVRALRPPGKKDAGSAAALLGIDMGKKPQDIVIRVRTERADGTTESRDLLLAVEAKEFPSTRLQVAPGMANPPKEVQEEIRRESELVAEVMSRVSPEWLVEGPFQSPLPDHEPFPNFGQRRVYNKTVSSIHSGVDISAPRGTPASATNGGRVVLASKLYLSGWTVIIDHGRGVFTNLHTREQVARAWEVASEEGSGVIVETEE
mgnify:CR=1 FL=1